MTENSPKNLWLIRGEVSEEDVLLCEEALEEVCLSVSFYEKETPEGTIVWSIEGMTETAFSQDQITHLLKGVFAPHVPLPNLICSPLVECDWLKESYESFPPLTIGNFYVYGSHHEGPLPVDKKGLLLDASTAFGSGHHATTAGCLTLLQTLSEKSSWGKILDLGCGSGILAMGAALLAEHAEIWATDNDPEAMSMTRTNALRNGLDHRLILRQSEGFRHIEKGNVFDLIMANILAQPLMNLAGDIKAFTRFGGHIILSGFFTTQWPDLQKIYEAEGFHYVAHQEADKWIALCLQKSGQ